MPADLPRLHAVEALTCRICKRPRARETLTCRVCARPRAREALTCRICTRLHAREALTCRVCARPRAGLVPLLGSLLVCLLVVLSGLLGASPAAAHAQLVSSTPAEGAVLEQAPEAVQLEFNERVQVHAEDTRVFTGDGSEVDADAVSSDRTVTVTPAEQLTEGTVVVSYSITSADGHRINGSITFAVGEPTAGAAASEVFEEPTTAGVEVAFGLASAVALGSGLALLVVALLGRWGPRREVAEASEQVREHVGERVGGRDRERALGRVRELCWPVGLVAAVVAVPLGVVHRGEFGWSGLFSWVHWIDGFLTWRGLLVLLALACAGVAVAALRRTSSGVAVIAALALTLVGGASLAVPGADPVPVSGIPAGDPVGEATVGEHTVRVSFESLMVGTTGVIVEVVDAEGAVIEPFAAPRLSLRSESVDLGDVELTEESPGAYAGQVTLPETGEWTVEVSARIDEFTNPVVELPFDVGRPATPTDDGGGGH